MFDLFQTNVTYKTQICNKIKKDFICIFKTIAAVVKFNWSSEVEAWALNRKD